METLEVLKLKQQNVLLQAQGLERDILVREHSRLMGEAQELQQTIMKMEEEVLRNENEKSKKPNEEDHIDFGCPADFDPTLGQPIM